MNPKEKAFEWSAEEKDAIIKDLMKYIIDTYEYGVDMDTLKMRVKTYKKYFSK